jgi:hypothetical protein
VIKLADRKRGGVVFPDKGGLERDATSAGLASPNRERAFESGA